MSTSSSASSPNETGKIAMVDKTSLPPKVRRDDSLNVPAGKLTSESHPQLFDKLIRQSLSSSERLLDPPKYISDPYGWMRDESRTNQEVLSHLDAENEYTKTMTSHLEDLRSDLYDEFLSYVKETDHSVPTPRGKHVYYTRTIEGKSYTIYCRAARENFDGKETLSDWDGSPDTPIVPGEQVYLDVNSLAEGKTYCSPGAVVPSPSEDLLGYTVDFSGGETCQLYVRNIATNDIVEFDETVECSGSLVWGSDDSTLFYIKQDEAHRPFQVYRHRVGTKFSDDELLFEEKDELYWVHISKSFDQRYLMISTSSKETSEIHYLDLKDETSLLQCLEPRRKKVLYDASHWKGWWFLTTNVGGMPNMKLMYSKVGGSSEEWKDVVDSVSGEPLFAGKYERSLDDITAFEGHIAATGREGGIPRIWTMTLDSNDDNVIVNDFTQLAFDETAYDVGLGNNKEFYTDKVVLAYDSLITPLQHIEVSMSDTSQRKILKEKAVPGYNKNEYDCSRITVTARDGKTEIPVSFVFRKDVMEGFESGNIESLPTHLYGYGSYGACVEASFRATRLALLNRGMVFVIAHVRGGGEMGRHWYEEPNGAKYLCKENTFNDFVDVARWLIDDKKITNPQKLSCEGRSAGGLLIGAGINQSPELFKMAILGVPFVDVICTMVDSSIPLTVVEWEEWGNPNEEKYFDYIMKYSPINNVKEGGKYPTCLLTGGLHDPRVQYWEPAKFAAELRHTQGDASGPVLLKIDMAAGHFSASDRYKYLKELAFDYAVLLDQLDLATSVDDKS